VIRGHATGGLLRRHMTHSRGNLYGQIVDYQVRVCMRATFWPLRTKRRQVVQLCIWHGHWIDLSRGGWEGGSGCGDVLHWSSLGDRGGRGESQGKTGCFEEG